MVFDSFAGNRINAGQEANATSIKVHFDQGFVDNGLRFPSCAVNPTALTVCPPSTRYGHGTAEGELFSSPGGPPTYVTAALSGYNGKPYQSKDPTEIIIASVAGKPTLELDFRVSREHGGLSFTEIHFPPAPGGTPGPRVSLARFHLIIPDRSEVINVHGKKRTIHLLQAPAVCHGSWTFSQTNTLANLPPLVATDSQPCSKR